jgi:hypothetical protein
VLKSNPEYFITHTPSPSVNLRPQDRYTLHPVMGDGNLLIGLPPQQCSNPCKILTCTISLCKLIVHLRRHNGAKVLGLSKPKVILFDKSARRAVFISIKHDV